MNGQWLLENGFWVLGMCCICVCVNGKLEIQGLAVVWQNKVLLMT